MSCCLAVVLLHRGLSHCLCFAAFFLCLPLHCPLAPFDRHHSHRVNGFISAQSDYRTWSGMRRYYGVGAPSLSLFCLRCNLLWQRTMWIGFSSHHFSKMPQRTRPLTVLFSLVWCVRRGGQAFTVVNGALLW